MTSKNEILERVRRNAPSDSELPEPTGQWLHFDDPVTQLIDLIDQVGGQAIRVGGSRELGGVVERLEVVRDADKICTLIPGVGREDVVLEQVARPHDLEDVDVAIVRGDFAVAENGAVWVTDADLPHRALLFLCQHLILVVPASEVLSNMHQAYQRLEQSGHFRSGRFGTFLSGPSKTADIEQALVIGAQGARSLVLLLVDP
jgi:L-lactate dehydrogenase complex protein LldG